MKFKYSEKELLEACGCEMPQDSSYSLDNEPKKSEENLEIPIQIDDLKNDLGKYQNAEPNSSEKFKKIEMLDRLIGSIEEIAFFLKEIKKQKESGGY